MTFPFSVFFDLVRKNRHISNPKLLAEVQSRCLLAPFVKLKHPLKNMRVHILAKHDNSVLTCEKCEKKCIGGTKLKIHNEPHREVT